MWLMSFIYYYLFQICKWHKYCTYMVLYFLGGYWVLCPRRVYRGQLHPRGILGQPKRLPPSLHHNSGLPILDSPQERRQHWMLRFCKLSRIQHRMRRTLCLQPLCIWRSRLWCLGRGKEGHTKMTFIWACNPKSWNLVFLKKNFSVPTWADVIMVKFPFTMTSLGLVSKCPQF